jgi:osmotically inducible protein OsmC
MKTHGSAAWSGGIKDGKGSISTKSGALQAYPYGFASRFEGKPGSNPEELIGAAHAACFTMALSLILGEAGLTAERMETTAEVTLDKVSDGFAITAVHLTLEAKIPGATTPGFRNSLPRPRRVVRSPSSSRPTSRWTRASRIEASA